ncbi:MAG: sigma 54-interacting transcriptional regulator [Deltaproteobacteria bacterium]|nr:sigma 54-interacting transcriptional regulator [Deltaproteobacteria bacterium]
MKNITTTTLEHAADPDPRPGGLLFVSGAGRLATHVLDRDALVIGRSPDCDIVIDHRALSRRHAILHRTPRLALQDLGSRNGTRLARGTLRGGEAVMLGLGESFHIGPLAFVVVAPPADPQEAGVAQRLAISDPSPDRVPPIVREIARSAVNVLIQGETGVGKEVLATTIHDLSGRAGPFTRINCAALSDALLESELFGHEKGAFTGAVAARAGLLEAAAGGTVFLDEIGELPLAIQAKLLRAVEAREVIRLGSTRPCSIDVRFIAATNRELHEEVGAGRFRRDLYFRLDGMTLRIPPLRERPELIAPLALKFLEGARGDGAPIRPTPELLGALTTYAWPGNVRELKAVVERAVLLSGGDEIGVRHLAFAPQPLPGASPPPPVAASPALPVAPSASAAAPLPEELAFLSAAQREDRERILAALEQCAGNQTRAAQRLAISRTTLVNKLALYRVPRPRR